MASKLSKNDIDLQVTSTDVEAQLKKLEQFPAEMGKELTKAVRQGDAIMKSDELPRVRRFSGSTADSIKSKIKQGGVGSVTGITGPSNKQLFYFRMMQDGRAPGAKMPPAEKLIGWVEAKFGTTGEASKQAAFLLARSIQANGIKGEQIARPVMENNKSRVLALLKVATDKIVEALKI